MALDLLLAPENIVFTASTGLAVLLAGVEIAGLAIGLSFAAFDGDVVSGPNADGGDAVAAVLGWMNPGRLPVLALIMIFLAAFGMAGLALQSLAAAAGGAYLAAPLAALVALANAAPLTRWLGGALARVLPRDESYDPAPMELIGSRGSISIGPAQAASPGRATIIDRHGNSHNLTVVPDGADDLPSGATIVITGYDGRVHRAVRAAD